MRICGICNRGVREGDSVQAVRVEAAHFSEAVLKQLKLDAPPAPGLYHGCSECVEAVKPGICKTLSGQGDHYTPETLPGNFLL